MTRKTCLNLILSGIILILSSIALMFNSIYSFKMIYLTLSVMIVNIIVFLLKIILCDKKVISSLYMITNIICIILIILLDYKNPTNLIIIFFFWIILTSFIKLNENKFLKENNKSMWIAKLILLIIFMVSGLLTIITLYNNEIKPIIEIGYFFFIYGTLEIISPISELLFKNEKKDA